MSPYVLLVISMSVALVSGIGTKLFLNRYNTGMATMYLFQTVSSAVAMIILFFWNPSFKISVFTALLGVVFGLLTAVQKIFSMKAMEIGPWSYTSVISSLSTIIPTLSGAVIWHESLSVVQIVGIALMLICICLSSDLKNDGGKTGLRWLIYCGITFLSTGMIGVLQKWHQNTPYKDELNEFLVVAFFISCLYTAVMTVKLFGKARRDGQFKYILAVVPILTMLASGIGSAVNNKLNLFLSGVLDSSIMFPVVNGGGLMLTTLSATLVFHEKLSKKQWIGLGIGLVSVILLCNPF